MVPERRETVHVRWATAAMAVLATATLQQALVEPGGARSVAIIWTLALFAVPTLAASWLFTKSASSPTSKFSGLVDKPDRRAAVIGLFVLFGLPLVVEALRLAITGRCAMLEIALLCAFRNLGLGLAALGCHPAYSRLSAFVSLFLVTAATAVGGESGIAVLAPLAGFAVVGIVWLMLVYWQSLSIASGPRPTLRQLASSSLVWVFLMLVLVGVVAAAGPSRVATTLSGFMPTSGGVDANDAAARSGVGDGDNEVAASERPQSVGFTESEVYLETDRPSLYDAFNESYGEPFKPKKVEKMIALGQQGVAEQKERPAENLQAGREFSAVRQQPRARTLRPSDREARALAYVKGPTPLHLPLAAHDHFDGRTWHEEPCCGRSVPAKSERGSAWILFPWSGDPFLSGVVGHQIKVGTLDSSPLPVPPHLTRLRVGSVNRLDFFGWAQYGIVRMVGRTAPSGTVIDSESRTVDPERLREIPLLARPDDSEDHFISFGAEYRIDTGVGELARNWVAGVPQGWAQIEAVVSNLRRHCVHDRLATAAPGSIDVVADFLLGSRRGPDYLFASAAVVMLRSLGYPARLVSGLYVAPDQYDPRTRHTPVTSEDVHVWAEVRLPNGRWIAVEPTPDYELLPPAFSWSELSVKILNRMGFWVKQHGNFLLIAMTLLAGLFGWRRSVLDGLGLVAFALLPDREPRRRVMRALRMVERRARWAGHPRPPGLTLIRWYRPGDHDGPAEPEVSLRTLIVLANWAAHAPDGPGSRAPNQQSEIERVCRQAVRCWTVDRFRVAFASPPGTVVVPRGQ